MRPVTGLLAALLLAGCPLAVFAQGLVIAQSVEQTQTIDRSVIEQLPAVEQQVSFLTGHGNERVAYTGALLWSLLERRETLSGDPRGRLRRTVAVTGRDGYVAVLALAEIDPEFEGKRVILAYRRDGSRCRVMNCVWWCQEIVAAGAVCGTW